MTGREHGQEPERERYVVSAERFRQAYESPEVQARLARARAINEDRAESSSPDREGA